MNDCRESGLLARLRCVECEAGELRLESQDCRCGRCGAVFPLYAGRPLLISRANRMFPIEEFGRPALRRRPRGESLRRFVPRPSVNLARRSALHSLSDALASDPAPAVLVVGAGRQRSQIGQMFRSAPGATIYCCDIDIRSDADVFCDAHDLPFRDGMFDCIVITAVLQMVADPATVVAEIARLLRPGGYVYSEISLLQHVTEGAYDFCRFTLSGHKVLFQDFQEIQSGLVAGPATVLVWAIEQTAVCLIPAARFHPFVRAAVRFCCAWFKYLDLVLQYNPASLDGASCTYLIGRKPARQQTAPADVARLYVGSRPLSHIQ